MTRPAPHVLAGALACALATAQLTGCAVPPEQTIARLVGVEWVVEDIGGRGVMDYARATLVFSADGRLSGRGSCNLYSARFTLTEETLVVSGLTTTDKRCAPAAMNQEARFLDLLRRAQTYGFDANGALTIYTADGQRLLARF